MLLPVGYTSGSCDWWYWRLHDTHPQGLLDHLELADIKSYQSMAAINYYRLILRQPLSSVRLFPLAITFNVEGPF